MSKQINKVFEFFESPFIAFAFFLVGLVFIFSSSAFLFQNNLMSWDHWAHLESAEFIKNNSWPNPVVWNPTYFNGYPENYFYPPLFSFIIATINFVLPITLAYKFFILFLYLITPFVFFFFAKTFFNKKDSLLVTLVLILAFFIPDFIYYGSPVGIGGTAYSTIFVGLGPALFGFLLLLVFIRLYEEKRNPIILGIIFCLGVLAHYVFLVSLVYVILSIIISQKLEIKKHLIILLTGISLSAWWWIPAVANREFVKSAAYLLPLNNLVPIAVVLGLVFLMTGKINQKVRTLFFTAIILFIFILVGEKLHTESQLFRLYYVIVFFSIPLIYSGITNIKNLKKIPIVFIKIIPLILATLIIISSFATDFTSTTTIELTTHIEKRDSLFMIMGDPYNRESHHALFYTFVKDTGNRVLRGLFSEDSPNIVTTSGMSLFVNPDEFVWGTTALKGDRISPSNFPKLLDYFGVSSIITSQELDPNIGYTKVRYLGKQITKENSTKIGWFELSKTNIEKPIYEYYFSEPQMAEVIDYNIFYYADANKDWDNFAPIYLGKESKVVTTEPVKNYFTDSNTRVTNIYRTNNSIKIELDSNTPVAVFVKESFFPNWNVGSNSKLYQAAPYLMLVVGQKEIILNYKTSIVENLAFILSLVCLIIITFYLTKQHLYKKKTLNKSQKVSK